MKAAPAVSSLAASAIRPVPALVAAAALAGCAIQLEPARSGDAPPTPAVAPSRPASLSRVSVVFTAPERGGEDVREVAVVFDRPMATAGAPLALSPAVPGAARWLGEHTLVFVAQAPLPPGRYTAVVSAAARAADGSVLGAQHAWTFLATRSNLATQRPRRQGRGGQPLRAYRAYLAGSRALGPGNEIRVHFSAPVNPRLLERHARLRLTGGRTIPLRARPHRPGSARVARLRPAEKFATAEGIHATLIVDAGLAAADGRPPLEAAFEESFPTVARLDVSWISCPESPASPLRIRFSDPVDPRAILRHLRLTPAIPLRLQTDETRGSLVAVGARFAPGERYRVELPAGIAAKGVLPLSAPRTQDCVVPVPQPRVRFAVQGSLLESAGPRQIPVWTELVPWLAIRLRSVSPESAPRVAHHRTAADALPLVHAQIVRGDARGRRRILVDPGPALPGGHGIALVEVEGLSDAGAPLTGTRRRLLVNATDLGITTKQSQSGVLAWVTRLSTGLPVEGAEVELRDPSGSLLGKATTDGDGVAEVAAHLPSRWQGNWTFVRQGADLAWIRTDENQWMFMPSMFDVPEWTDEGDGRTPALRGILFTDRGIYRPGDTVRLKGILRRETANLETVPGTPATVVVHDASGKEVFSRTVRTSEFGTFALDVPLSQAASLGAWRAIVRAGDPAWRRSVRREFRVEEFRAPDFEVKVQADRRNLLPGESPRFLVSGRYFFGAAMKQAPVSWTVTARAVPFTPPKHPSYIWRPLANPWEDRHVEPDVRVVASDEGSLDERGERVVAVRGAEPGRVYTLEAQVTGIDRTTVAGRAAAVVHPAAFYLGVLAEWTFLEVTETFRADLVAAAPDGSRVAHVPIDARIYHGSWDSVRRLHQGGTASFTSRAAPRLAGRCQLVSGETPARCEFRPGAGGHYVLWAVARDAAGRRVETAISFYVLGPSATSWAASDSVKVTLRADRHEYKVGDTARILVQNPFPEAEALVTLERDRVLRRFRQRLVGPAPAVRIPVTEDLMPNVFVSVVLVRGRVPGPWQVAGDDPRRPLMRVGHALVRVSSESRRIQVDVTPDREEYRPGGIVTVRLRTRDPAGRPLPSEVTLWAVDEGVLSLVAYRTPDPVRAMHAPRGLGIMTTDNRYRILRRASFEEKGIEVGGGGGEGGGPTTRKVFEAVAHFDPSVRTGQGGRATVRFRLPDNLTTFRIMAVAVTRAQRFGSGEAKIVSTKRLLLQPALPRFARAGDRLEAGVVVHNRTREPGVVKVRIRAQGIRLAGPDTRSVHVAAGRGAEVRFPLRAERPGLARLAFEARLGRERDAVAVTRVVHLPTPLEHIGVSGEAQAPVRRVLAAPRAIRRDAGGLEVVLSGSRLAALMPALASLVEYPYGCAEQTTSRTLPLIALRDLAAVTGERGAAGVDALVRAGLARIATFQRPTGGFGYWAGSGDEDPWLSAYVMAALATARSRGFEVERPVVEAGIGYLRRILRAGLADAPTRAWVLWAMATFGEKEPAHGSLLYDRRADLGTEGRAVLAMALGRMRDPRVAPLLSDLVAEARLEGERVLFADVRAGRHLSSAVRTQALVLEALAKHEPGHALVPLLARSILRARVRGRWPTTQETARALLALTAAERAEAASGPRSAVVRVNGQVRLRARFGPGRDPFQRLFVPIADLGEGAVDLRVEPSRGSVRFSARLSFAPAAPPRDPADRGIALSRTYERVASPGPGAAALGTASTSRIHAGDLVRVTLHIAVPREIEHAVVDDPLPSGLEAVNVALATEARSGAEPDRDSLFTHRELRDDRVILYAPRLRPGIYRHTYLARAATAGRFAAPAVRAKAMYEPERAGSGASGTLTVVAR